MQDLLVTEPDLAAGFQHTKFLVMDEADRLLEPSFEPDLRAILTKLPATRQTLLFSATMTQNLVALQKAVLQDAYHFQVCMHWLDVFLQRSKMCTSRCSLLAIVELQAISHVARQPHALVPILADTGRLHEHSALQALLLQLAY